MTIQTDSMAEFDDQHDPIDWRLTTWEGAQREQMRRWAELPLERIILAQEEMREISEILSAAASAVRRERA